ncbi:Nif3-like dinuclear metal center hexameric protein [Paenibacillus sp. FSL W7-1287]|uniref:Nif3-like dinuclear metal center hexameric protein n=1 Tax=Paenibacillus sp. FSL W7-1287 TaxID=2954538 RepID=UPI0030F524BD
MSVTIKQIIDTLPSSPVELESTVDQLLYGNENDEVSEIAVTFMANQEVLEQAVQLGIRFIISHEGLYYSHHQAYPLPEDSDILYEREQFIKKHGLAIYRYHDHCHRHQPDLITRGLVNKLDWQKHISLETAVATIVQVPPTPLQAIITAVKDKLQLPYIRFRGEQSKPCRNIGVLVGYRGNGASLIPLIAKHQLDAVIIGEGMEWEAPEYIRDAAALGSPCGIIVLGHAESELPGIDLIGEMLQQALPQLQVHHLKAQPIYTIG